MPVQFSALAPDAVRRLILPDPTRHVTAVASARKERRQQDRDEFDMEQDRKKASREEEDYAKAAQIQSLLEQSKGDFETVLPQIMGLDAKFGLALQNAVKAEKRQGEQDAFTKASAGREEAVKAATLREGQPGRPIAFEPTTPRTDEAGRPLEMPLPGGTMPGFLPHEPIPLKSAVGGPTEMLRPRTQEQLQAEKDVAQAKAIEEYRARQQAEQEFSTTNPAQPPNPTEASLAWLATQAGPEGERARKALQLMKPEDRPEAGSYLTVTDQRGQVTHWVNPKTGKVITPASLGIEDAGFRGAMSMDRQTRETAATSGLKVIQDFRAELKRNPNLLAQLAVPGSPGARKAAAMRAELIDVLTRVRTGAALNTQEEAFYAGQAPSLLDSLFGEPDTIEYKLSLFEQNFKGLAPPAAKGGGKADPLGIR